MSPPPGSEGTRNLEPSAVAGWPLLYQEQSGSRHTRSAINNERETNKRGRRILRKENKRASETGEKTSERERERERERACPPEPNTNGSRQEESAPINGAALVSVICCRKQGGETGTIWGKHRCERDGLRIFPQGAGQELRHPRRVRASFPSHPSPFLALLALVVD
jgi:ferric-dicitrate binding protein FerR (iron transport regulator)